MHFNRTPDPGYVYIIGSTRFGWFKIGKARRADIRVEQLGILLPFRVEVHAIWECRYHSELERAMHEFYTEDHLNGEWFSFDAATLTRALQETPLESKRIFPIGKVVTKPIRSCNVKQDVVRSAWFEKEEAERREIEDKRASDEKHERNRCSRENSHARGQAFSQAMNAYKQVQLEIGHIATSKEAKAWVLEAFPKGMFDETRAREDNVLRAVATKLGSDTGITLRAEPTTC